MTFGPYEAVVTRTVDGDSFWVAIDLASLIEAKTLDFGFGVVVPRPKLPLTIECRVLRINSPEVSTDAGKTARDFAAQLCPVGTPVKVTSHGWDKYGGRFDGDVTLPDGRDYAQVMLDAGQAVPYSGGAR